MLTSVNEFGSNLVNFGQILTEIGLAHTLLRTWSRQLFNLLTATTQLGEYPKSFGIPKTTLLRHIGCVQEGRTSPVAMGRKPILTNIEELFIADWVNRNAIDGFGILP